MLAQQFVAGLPPPIRQKILETTEDVTLPKAISTAKRLLALQQPETLAPVGTTPYEELTTALAKQMDVTAALAKQIETVTNKLESLSMDAAERQQRSRVKTFFGNCWNCGKQGHVSARCLEPRRGSASGSDDGSQNNSRTAYPVSLEHPAVTPSNSHTTLPLPTSATVVYVDALVGGKQRRCLVDTGAGVSLIPPTIDLENSRATHSTPIALEVANGSILQTQGTVDLDVLFSQRVLRWSTGEESFSTPVTGITTNCRAILADDVVLDPSYREVMVWAELVDDQRHKVCGAPNATFEPDVEGLSKVGVMAAHSVVDGRTGLVPVRLLNVCGATKLYRGKGLGVVKELSQIACVPKPSTPCRNHEVLNTSFLDWSNSNLNPEEREQLCDLLKTYSDVFSTGPHDLGRTTATRHSIITEANARPIRQRQYRQPYHMRAEMDKQIGEMLIDGLIKPSTSPWSSPVLMVPKKDGSSRFCVDFRALNEVTVKDPFPLPRIDETLESLGGAKYFTTLDLAAGYWQVELEQKDRQKTAFTTPRGHFEFDVMPFGLCNVPATFRRLMDSVLRD